jgi:hypothetical protein
MRGWQNKKTVFNKCKCNRTTAMYKRMDKKDFEHMNLVLMDTTLDEILRHENYVYWKKRVNGRIEDLTPLINECKEKNIPLFNLSPELHEEWIELHNVKLFYNF